MRKSKRVLVLLFSLLFIVSLLIPAVRTEAAESSPYTYTYDYWYLERESPDAYTVAQVLTGDNFGIGNFISPQGLFVTGNNVYVCDTGNNRIVEFSYKDGAFTFIKIIDKFMNNGKEDTLGGPQDIYVTKEGEYFICDTSNQRVVHLDQQLNLVKSFIKPEDETFASDAEFLPQKLVIDSAGRMYVQAQNINKGFMEYDSEGNFSGYVGASEPSFDFIDYVWKLMATKEQRKQLEDIVPTEYNNITLDSEGFIYATLAKFENVFEAKPIRKLNAIGNDILIRNGYDDPVGDVWFGNAGGISGPSKFADITVLENDTYYAVDSIRGRVFGYDFQGNLLYAFGGIGYKQGYFKNPSAIVSLEDSLLILDMELGSMTQMTLTEYGKYINEGLTEYKNGNYEESANMWKEVLRRNGNYDLAYIGIGRALLRQGKYKEAMEYFKIKVDYKSYSKALKLYRKEWIEDNIGWIFGILIGVMILVSIKNFIRKVKKEVREG